MLKNPFEILTGLTKTNTVEDYIEQVNNMRDS